MINSGSKILFDTRSIAIIFLGGGGAVGFRHWKLLQEKARESRGQTLKMDIKWAEKQQMDLLAFATWEKSPVNTAALVEGCVSTLLGTPVTMLCDLVNTRIVDTGRLCKVRNCKISRENNTVKRGLKSDCRTAFATKKWPISKNLEKIVFERGSNKKKYGLLFDRGTDGLLAEYAVAQGPATGHLLEPPEGKMRGKVFFVKNTPKS